MRFLLLLVTLFGCHQDLHEVRGTGLLAVKKEVVTVFSSVTYVRSYDGDTITINLPNSIPDVFGHEIPVRVRHIDAPEIKGLTKCEKDAAQKAKAAISSILEKAKIISLEDVGRDKYFRLLCSVNITTQTNETFDLSNYLIAEGYAVPYEGETKPKTDWCKLLRKISR
jgi:endonuclease YncB( thermonuclease family)